MLRGLKNLLRGGATGNDSRGAGPPEDDGIRVAAAALLLELAHADDHVHVLEHAAIAQGLAGHFRLDAAAVESLLARAEAARRQAIDVHGFTSVLVNELGEPERITLAEVLWQVVLADGELTADESILARRLGNLLDLRPEDVAVSIQRARGRRTPPPGM